MKFLSPLVVLKSSTDPGDFILYEHFKVEFNHRDTPYCLTVPKGFITDFASVPRLAQMLPGFDKTEGSANAAVVHDYMYCCRGDLFVVFKEHGRFNDLTLTRRQCDRLLYDGLIASGYSKWVAGAFYSAVRLGGWLYWRRRKDGLNPGYDFVPHDFDWSRP